MYYLKRSMFTETAHQLKGHSGLCKHIHGHSYKWTVVVKALNLTNDMVMDFSELKEKLGDILSGFDHVYLNDIPYFKKHNPTSENIAKFIHSRLAKDIKNKKIKVSIWETANSRASFEK